MTTQKPTARTGAKDQPDRVKERMQEHPGGTAAGAAGGAMVGAATGIGAGPIGLAAGAVAGAVAGAMRGSGVRGAREVTVEREDAHWREHFAAEPYTAAGASYDDWGPAYRLAVDEWLVDDGRRSWDNALPALADAWNTRRERSRLSWQEAQQAARAAWARLDDVARPGSDTDAGL
jgi:hypothetical protein